MRRSAVFVFVAAAFAASFAFFVHADGPDALSGSVRTAEGLALPQVPLKLEGPGGARRVLTGPDGRFRVVSLSVGDYRVVADTSAFAVTTAGAAGASPVSVLVGDGEAKVDLILAPAPLREHVLVAATRNEAARSTLGVSATVIEREEIDARGATSLLPLLQDAPGVAVARTGGVGLQGSAFLRGGDSRYARVLIDGVPVNQPGGNFDLGSAIPLELERIEIVRGAASSLYGTDALAGVIHLVSRRAGPQDAVGFEGEGEGGSFGWQRYRAATSGRANDFDWNAGLQRLDTDNEQPNSA